MFLYIVFGANFDKISATAYYPTKPDDAIGGGTLNDVKIPKNSKWVGYVFSIIEVLSVLIEVFRLLSCFFLNHSSTIHFPFSINYTTSYDSDLSVLKDIATKCGFLGNSGTSDLKVNYKVETKVKVIAVTVSPTWVFTLPFFPCISRALSLSLSVPRAFQANHRNSLCRSSVDETVSQVQHLSLVHSLNRISKVS
jgi:hypothetical protein